MGYNQNWIHVSIYIKSNRHTPCLWWAETSFKRITERGSSSYCNRKNTDRKISKASQEFSKKLPFTERCKQSWKERGAGEVSRKGGRITLSIQPAFQEGPLRSCRKLAPDEGGPDFRGLGEGWTLTKSLVGKCFVPHISRDKHSSDYLWGKEYGTLEDLCLDLGLDTLAEHVWILRKSCGKGWFFARRHFLKRKSGRFL